MKLIILKQDSKKFYKSESGSVSVLGLFVTISVLSAMAAVYKNMISENKETRERLNTYLCFKHGLKKIKQSHKTIYYTNKSLTLLNLSKVLNPGPHIEAAKKVIQTTQYLSYLNYTQSILFKKECYLWNKQVLLEKYPYKLTAFKTLKRSPTGHAIIVRKKDTLKVTSFKSLQSSFTLYANYVFSPLFQLKLTKEVPLLRITQAL